MRKLGRILVASILGVTTLMTGCSTPSTTPGGSNNTETSNGGMKQFPGATFLPEKGATIRVAESNEARSTGYAEVLASKFEEAYKEYDITVEIVPDSGFQLEIDGPAGMAPDVFSIGNAVGQWYPGQLVMPIDPAIKAMNNNDIPEWAWESFSYNDTEYGYPMTVQTSMLLYRKSLVPEVWQDEKGEMAVETWNDLYAMNREIKEGEHTDSTLTHGIMYGADNVYMSYGILESYGAYIFKDGTDSTDVGFHQGEAYKGAKVLRDFSETMYDTHVTWETTNQIPSEMAGGKFLGTITTPNQVVNIVDQLLIQEVFATEEEAYSDIGYMILPELPLDGDIKTPLEEGEETVVCKSMGGTSGMLVSSFTQYPNTSRLYASYATQAENVLERAEYTSLTPIRYSTYEQMTEAASVMFEQTQEGRFVPQPTITAVNQMWGPAIATFGKFVNDHHDDSVDFSLDEVIKEELEALSKSIVAAVTALE